MTETVYVIHGWGESPEEPIYKWIATVLEGRGYEVIVPEMPNPEEPKVDEWVSKLKETVSEVNEKTYFIGASIGCQTVMRFLEALPERTKCAGAVFIAPWFHLQGLEPAEEKIAAPWLENQIDLGKVSRHIKKMTAIFSDNDPYVPLSDRDIFHAAFNAETMVEHDKGHFTAADGVTQLPSALEAFSKIANQ